MSLSTVRRLIADYCSSFVYFVLLFPLLYVTSFNVVHFFTLLFILRPSLPPFPLSPKVLILSSPIRVPLIPTSCDPFFSVLGLSPSFFRPLYLPSIQVTSLLPFPFFALFPPSFLFFFAPSRG